MLLLLLFTLSVATRLLVTNDVVTNLAIKSIHKRLLRYFFVFTAILTMTVGGDYDDDCLLAMTIDDD